MSTTDGVSSIPAAGWYPEPGTGRHRWWTGSVWGGYAPPEIPASPAGQKAEGRGVQIAGYICAAAAAVMPIVGLAGLILGILTATKRGRGGHGAAIIILSIVVAAISFIVWVNVFLHHAAASTGSCYFDTSGNYVCP